MNTAQSRGTSVTMYKTALLVTIVTLLLQPVYLDDSSSSSSSSSEEDNFVEHNKLNLKNCGNKKCGEQQEKSIVCYFTNWAWYRSGRAKFTPDNINASLCTHINYAFASLDKNSLTIVPYDSWADIDNKFYELVTGFKSTGIKVLIAIGGWNDSEGDKWSRLLSNATARANFVSSVMAFCEKYNFDGLDMDYEYPGCPQGNRTAGLPTDKENFNLLMSELKSAFKGKYLLTVATAGGKSTINDCYNMAELCQLVDWVNVMTYDYNSYTDGKTGAVAPFSGSGSTWGVVETVKYYLEELKCPADKIVLGIPFYAKTFTMVDPSPVQFGVPVSGPGTAGTYTKVAGTLAYYEVCLLIRSGWQRGFNKAKDSYIWNDTQFASFDSQVDIVRKSGLVNKDFNLRGAMLWTMDFDDFNNMCGCRSYPLLKTLNNQLRSPQSTGVTCY